MGKVNFLRSVGLLNKDTGDWGEIAGAVPKKVVAFCSCGHVELDTFKDSCPQCKHALFWQRLSRHQFTNEKQRYLHKMSENVKNKLDLLVDEF